jgi:hypothetical protein
MTAAKTKKPQVPKDGRSVIVQVFSPNSHAGLGLLFWLYSLPEAATEDDKTKLWASVPKVFGLTTVLTMALEHFAHKYADETPDYVEAPAKGHGKLTSMSVPTRAYVAVKQIALRDREKFEHAVETAIQDFLADVLTPRLKRFIQEAPAQLRASETRRKGKKS